jgi:uncharacterized protein YqgC (DUF456 family)
LSPLDAFGLTIFILLLFLGIFVCLHGLPGMVLIVVDVLVFEIITGFGKIGWGAFLALCLIAVAVEIADVFFAMKGSPRFGPSKQSVAISFAGCCLFALLLTPAFLIIGLVGGFFLGGVLGMLCALMIQEIKLKPSYRMPFRVLIARLASLLFKGSVATALVCFTLLSSYD